MGVFAWRNARDGTKYAAVKRAHGNVVAAATKTRQAKEAADKRKAEVAEVAKARVNARLERQRAAKRAARAARRKKGR